MKVTTISVNCGNDRSGIEGHIREMLQGDNAPDILTINAQEVKFGTEFQTIQSMLEGTNYAVAAFEPRITATKPGVFFSRDTGLSNFVVYDKTKFLPPQTIGKKDIVSLSGFSNKGALINKVELTPINGAPPIRLGLIAGHLDSNKQNQRLSEWHKIYKTIHPEVENWEELEQKIMDMTIGGFDANVRYALGDPQNYWQGEGNAETKIYLNTLPLGVVKSSAEPTYNKVLLEQIDSVSSVELSETPAETDSRSTTAMSIEEMCARPGKRPGLADMGNLDILTVMTGQEADVSHSVTCTTIPFDGSTKRDHSAVVNSFEFTPYANAFEKVKSHVLSRIKLLDQGQGTHIYQELSEALSREGLNEVEAKGLLVEYYNRHVVAAPSQNFQREFDEVRSRSNSDFSTPQTSPSSRSSWSSRSPSPVSSEEDEMQVQDTTYNPMHRK